MLRVFLSPSLYGHFSLQTDTPRVERSGGSASQLRSLVQEGATCRPSFNQSSPVCGNHVAQLEDPGMLRRRELRLVTTSMFRNIKAPQGPSLVQPLESNFESWLRPG